MAAHLSGSALPTWRTGPGVGVPAAWAASAVAGRVREWHLAQVIVTTDTSNTLRGLGNHPEMLRRRIAQIEGRVHPARADLAKAWCFWVANVFPAVRAF